MSTNQNKLKLVGIFLLSVFVATAAYSSAPQAKQQPPLSREQLNQILQNPEQLVEVGKHLILNRRKVGLRVEYIYKEMAKIIDENAEHNTLSVREAVQEISYRIRQAIEKFEEKYDVGVELHHESKKGLVHIACCDFIKDVFVNPYFKAKQDLKRQSQRKFELYTYNKKTVGVKLKYIAMRMAEIVDASAAYSVSTIREATQEVADRILIAIDEYEKKRDVCLVVYHDLKNSPENVTGDFLKETFPYAVIPSDC